LGITNPRENSPYTQNSLSKEKNKSLSTDYSTNGSPKLSIKNQSNSNSTISNPTNSLSNTDSSQSNNKNSKSSVEFNEPESVCKILLSELFNIKKCLIKSSKDIERIFKLPFSHLKVNVSLYKYLLTYSLNNN
jgi:hypothetical protein